jgi:hypothetical protein
MIFLYIFGNNVNDKMGQLGYLGFYLAGGVFSGVAHLLSSIHPALGASGAISAVTGAFLVLLPRSHITIVCMLFFIGMTEIAALWFVLLFFVQDVFFQLLARTSSVGGGVAHMAHIGGTAYGFLVCMGLLGTGLLPRDMFDLFGIADRWNRRRVHRDAVRRGYDPFGFQPAISPATERAKPHANLDRVHDLRAEISDAIGKQDMAEAVRKFMELRAIDPQQVLPRQTQLDVANQLFADAHYHAAADAYEG